MYDCFQSDLESFCLATDERFSSGTLCGNYINSLFFWVKTDKDIGPFFPTEKYSVKTQHRPWTLDGSWLRTVICLILLTTQSCWQQVRCYVFYLFPTQRLSTTDGRTCLHSIDPGDLVQHQCKWNILTSSLNVDVNMWWVFVTFFWCIMD